MQAAIEMHDHYADFMQPFSDALLAAAGLGAADRVLDVGCGTGDTTLAAAAHVTDGFAHGVDLEPELVAFARGRACGARVDNVSFAVADAGRHLLDDASFEHVLSRNGTLHFDDPVAAWANLRRACRPGGRLTFTAPRSAALNPWFTTMVAAIGRVVSLPMGADGPFVLADPDRIRALLGEAGWREVALHPLDTRVRVGRDVDDALHFFTHTDGARLRRALDPDTWRRVLGSLAEALAPHVTPAGVWLGASSWVVQARG